MFQLYYDPIANAVLVLLYVFIGIRLVQRFMEAKGMKYSVTEVPYGRVFCFSLGLYAGRIHVHRTLECHHPTFIRHVDGWEVQFPMRYTEDEMDCYLMYHNPPYAGNTSHSRDMDVYREVVIRKNDELSCVGGDIYCAMK